MFFIPAVCVIIRGIFLLLYLNTVNFCFVVRDYNIFDNRGLNLDVPSTSDPDYMILAFFFPLGA